MCVHAHTGALSVAAELKDVSPPNWSEELSREPGAALEVTDITLRLFKLSH